MAPKQPELPWLEPEDSFPDANSAWKEGSPAPGLLAAGADLAIGTLLQAYRSGIFPWYSEGQPILWWSPDPRMVLKPENFKLHPSLRKTLKRFISNPASGIRIDSAFGSVIGQCAMHPRKGQPGTWIVPAMREAYIGLHQNGYAHSVETWIDGELVGGLYCVAIGRAVFGESMFSHRPDASKLALAALVALCRHYGVTHIDCQQNTAHLASLGAAEVPRAEFLQLVAQAHARMPIQWNFEPLYWDLVMQRDALT